MDFAIFSPSSLFADEDVRSTDDKTTEFNQSHVEREHQFPGMVLRIQEFAFHELNANLLWPGTFSFAEWLVEHLSWIKGRRIIELGSGTGAMAIFLKKSFQLDITTSDYNDQEIEENIAHNCRISHKHMQHLKPSGSMLLGMWFAVVCDRATGTQYASPTGTRNTRDSWGDSFPTSDPDWDLVIASDILLYVKQYANLIKTLSFLLNSYKPKVIDESIAKKNGGDSGPLCPPAFLMSWRRRIGKEDESLFFNGCEDAGLQVLHLGARVYCIKPRESNTPNKIT